MSQSHVGGAGDRDELGVDHLRFERQGPIARCTIDRPQARNAATPDMYRGIARAVELVTHDPDLRALVLTGVGEFFLAGGDVETATSGKQDIDAPFSALRNSRVPVVVAVNGLCLASGVVVALLGDLAVCSERAAFALPEATIGFPETWSAAVLPLHIGMGRARELALTGRRVLADEALAIGLVNRVVPHDALLDTATSAAHDLLRAGPEARNAWRRAAHAHYGVVDELTFQAGTTSPEFLEGVRSFVERRDPGWAAARRTQQRSDRDAQDQLAQDKRSDGSARDVGEDR